jgi:uncharacterized protein YaaQ
VKLVIAVVHERDRQPVNDALVAQGFSFTNIASTGGFLREGNATFLIGVQDDDVERLLGVIADNSKTREQHVNVFPPTLETMGACVPTPVEVEVGGAVCFVVPVERFEKL